MRSLNATTLIQIAALVALVWLSFGHILGGYFLADDIWQVPYAGRIADGNLKLLWENFTGNFMHISSSAVYRPLITLSMVVDYLLWKVNAFGYLLTNLLWYTADVVLVFLTARILWETNAGGTPALHSPTLQAVETNAGETPALHSPTLQAVETNAGETPALHSPTLQAPIPERRLPAGILSFPFFAAALFAVNPLHAEPVCWIAGRSDLICAFFYLGSLCLVLLYGTRAGSARECRQDAGAPEHANGMPAGRRRSAFFASIALFWLALLSKEMAVGLPVVITAAAFLLFPSNAMKADSVNAVPTLGHRFVSAFKFSAPFWISLVVYFILRYMFLGTIFGGYTDVVALTLKSSMMERLADPAALYKLFFPFSESLFHGSLVEPFFLGVAYLGILGIGIWHLVKQRSFAMPAFLIIWIATCIAPAISMWGIGPNLETSRVYFFATIPASLLLAFFAVHHAQPRAAKIAAIVFIICILTVFVQSTRLTCGAWLDAGKEVRAVAQKSIELLQNSPPNARLIIMGLPKERNGALLITNGGMFLQLLKPPYTEQNLGERFLIFERVHTEPDTFINTSRFKSALQNSEVRGPYIFDERNNAFVLIDHGSLSTNQTHIEVDLTKAVSSAGPNAVPALYKASPTECTLENLTNDDFLKLTGFTVSPTAVDYIEFEYLCQPEATKKGVITVAWKIPELGTKGTAATVIWPQSRWQKARIHLSHYWRWYATKEIPELYLLFFPTKKLELRNVRLVSAAPTPEVAVSVPPTELGVRFVDAENIALLVKTQHIPEAKSIDLEISKPNYFFDSFYYTDQNPALAESTRMETPGDRPIKLVPKSVPTSAYYQIRVRAFDKTGDPIGEPSDAITLFVRHH